MYRSLERKSICDQPERKIKSDSDIYKCKKARTSSRPVVTLRLSQAKLGPQCLAKSLDSFGDLIRRRSRECRAEEHAILFGGLVGLKPAASGHQDISFGRGVEDRLFDGVVALTGNGPRVLSPVDLDPVLPSHVSYFASQE